MNSGASERALRAQASEEARADLEEPELADEELVAALLTEEELAALEEPELAEEERADFEKSGSAAPRLRT